MVKFRLGPPAYYMPIAHSSSYMVSFYILMYEYFPFTYKKVYLNAGILIVKFRPHQRWLKIVVSSYCGRCWHISSCNIFLFYCFTTSHFSKTFLIGFQRFFDKFEKGKLKWISINKSKFEPISTKRGSYLMILFITLRAWIKLKTLLFLLSLSGICYVFKII